MSDILNNPRFHDPSASARRHGSRTTQREASPTSWTRPFDRIGAVSLKAFPTIDLVHELARREGIAINLAIDGALVALRYAKARPPETSEGDGYEAEANS